MFFDPMGRCRISSLNYRTSSRVEEFLLSSVRAGEFKSPLNKLFHDIQKVADVGLTNSVFKASELLLVAY